MAGSADSAALNENDMIAPLKDRESPEEEQLMTFMEHDFGLDRRLIKAVAKMGFVYPTLVQSKCIPLALKGKDLLVRYSFESINRVQ